MHKDTDLRDTPDDTGGRDGTLDLSTTLGRFLMVSQRGRVFALRQLRATRTLGHMAPGLCDVPLDVVETLVLSLRRSPMIAVVHTRPRVRIFYLANLRGMGTRKVRFFHDTTEIIEGALEQGQFPVLQLGELQQAATASSRYASPLAVPMRWLHLRDGLPERWTDALRGIFLANLEDPAEKEDLLGDKVATLRDEIGRSMVEGWLTKCLWMNSASGLLGRVSGSRNRTGFAAFLTGDTAVRDFYLTLDRDDSGRPRSLTGVANVVPALVRGMPWTGPTVHVFDADFRTRHKLREHYSLYRGLEALSEIGAPVLAYREHVRDQVIAIHLLRPMSAAGALAEISARRFPNRHLVWDGSRRPLR